MIESLIFINLVDAHTRPAKAIAMDYRRMYASVNLFDLIINNY